ncbi:hypothetical protein J5X84_33775 [Streptosporangiaceae bacterium NEAU-GS5]|nr:hypothetical protein [Streptosporangiaceae bacterium NEAU-GS5]
MTRMRLRMVMIVSARSKKAANSGGIMRRNSPNILAGRAITPETALIGS